MEVILQIDIMSTSSEIGFRRVLQNPIDDKPTFDGTKPLPEPMLTQIHHHLPVMI